MALANYLKVCEQSVAGSDYRLYIGVANDIATQSWSSETLQELTMNDDPAATYFSYVEADLDGVHFTAEGEGGTGFMSEQSLILKFRKKSKTLVEFVEKLRDKLPCGLVAIRKDGHNQYWISGIAPPARVGENLYWNKVETNFDSGESVENWEEGNLYTVTLKRTSGTEEFLVSSGAGHLGEGLDDGDAAIVNWPA
jgi:hypothetical protein